MTYNLEWSEFYSKISLVVHGGCVHRGRRPRYKLRYTSNKKIIIHVHQDAIIKK